MPITKQYNTAILVFANSSQEELKHKSIHKGNILFDALTSRTLETVEKTQLPYFHITEKQQIGNSFGERFTNAIQAVLDKGYEQVITIGNDSPQLQVSHILEAEKQLNSKKFVLGPTTDGGFYLMGIHKSQFNSNAFKQLAWQTSLVSKQLLRLVTNDLVKVVRLQTLFDIDTVQDIKSILAYAYKIPKELYIILVGILQSKENISEENYSFLPHIYFQTNHNKGSPEIFPS